MRSKPVELYFYSAFFVVVAFAFPLQIFIMHSHAISEWNVVLSKLAPLNWASMGACALLAYLILFASPWAYLFNVIALYVVFKNNLLVADVGEDFSYFTPLAATAGFAASLGFLYTRRLRDYILNEKIRWWLTPRRYSAVLKVLLDAEGLHPKALNGKGKLEAETYDISKTGAFVAHNELSHIPKNTRVYIELYLGPKFKIKGSGIVVRTSDHSGRYPAGAGIRFDKLRLHDRLALNWLTVFLKKER